MTDADPSSDRKENYTRELDAPANFAPGRRRFCNENCEKAVAQ
jgi:hypothetical protein